MEQYIQREERIATDGVPEGEWPNDGHTPLVMYEAQFAPTGKGYSWSKWFVCPLCARTFPVSEGEKIGGQYYSIENGCAAERRSKK